MCANTQVFKLLLLFQSHMSEYPKSELPPETISIDGRTWQREKFDRDAYQWVLEMDEDEYDWDPEEDDISLVGTDVPIRVVILRLDNGEWQIEGAETAGPDYHRPGFTELISGDYSESFPEEQDKKAFKTAKDFMQRLS
jgi:hypothetical protein